MNSDMSEMPGAGGKPSWSAAPAQPAPRAMPMEASSSFGLHDGVGGFAGFRVAPEALHVAIRDSTSDGRGRDGIPRHPPSLPANMAPSSARRSCQVDDDLCRAVSFMRSDADGRGRSLVEGGGGRNRNPPGTRPSSCRRPWPCACRKTASPSAALGPAHISGCGATTAASTPS